MSEHEFVEQFLIQLRRGKMPWRRRGHQVLVREADCYQGRVDVLGAVFAKRPPEQIRRAADVLAQPSGAAILGCLWAGRHCTVDEIAVQTGFSKRVLRARARQLVSHGLIEVATHKLKLRKSAWPAFELWAFEAKLDKWQRALYQATQYRGFTHRSYVVMPSARARSAIANSERFRVLGIGLIVVDERGRTSVQVRARRGKPFSPALQQIALGRVLSLSPTAG